MPGAPARTGTLQSSRQSATTTRSSSTSRTRNATASSASAASASTASSTTNSVPGAYSVRRSASGPTQVFRVTVPSGVSPGSEFQVYAGARVVRVSCPSDARPGQSLQISIPPEPVVMRESRGMAPLTSSVLGVEGGGAVPMRAEIALQNNTSTASTPPPPPQEQQPQQPAAYMVTVPPHVQPGQQFAVTVNQQQFMVTCPSNARPGMSVRIVPPTPPPAVSEDALHNSGAAVVEAPPQTQMFEVVVPPGVRPNQPFTLIAAGQRVLVTCPANASAGKKIRFQLPIQPQQQQNTQEQIQSVQLNYNEKQRGWCRTIRVTDMKFQWVRLENDEGSVNRDLGTFHPKSSAYVRKLTFLEGNDSRMRTGTLTLVPANEAVVDSRIPNPKMTGRDLVSYGDIAAIQNKPFDQKTEWFEKICSDLGTEWAEGHMQIKVRRQHLLHDSVEAVMALSRADLRMIWRFEFLGEQGIDAGGLAREWFQLVTDQIFDPDSGLWRSSFSNQMCMTINPASELSCPDDHLIYFRFLGRVMGKALFDRQLISGHMVQHLYKHILGWPVTFDDLEMVDAEFHKSMLQLLAMASSEEDVTNMCLDFTYTEETLGIKTHVDLVPDGSNKEVTNENLSEYLELICKYRLLERIKPQLNELLLGFFDVIPEPLLTIFDYQELELVLCGLPKIDLDDWKQNTNYVGSFVSTKAKHRVCTWFWEIVRDDFDQEMKARLLQFVTGTSGVPARGFSVLQGNDGVIREFTLNGIQANVSSYPKAHTCFNRLDLPLYTSKKELFEKLKLAVTTCATGFYME